MASLSRYVESFFELLLWSRAITVIEGDHRNRSHIRPQKLLQLRSVGRLSQELRLKVSDVVISFHKWGDPSRDLKTL